MNFLRVGLSNTIVPMDKLLLSCFMMIIVQKIIVKLNSLMEIVLMKMGHLLDIFANLYELDIYLLYIFS